MGQDRKNIEKHREEKMKYVKTLNVESRRTITSRAHNHAIKCILMLFTLISSNFLSDLFLMLILLKLKFSFEN